MKNTIIKYITFVLLGISLASTVAMYYLYKDTQKTLEISKELWKKERQKIREYEIKKIEELEMVTPTDSAAFRILGWELSD